MKTSISEFCSEFSETLFPLAEALGDTVQSADSLGGASVAGLTEGLANARHRLEALINKVQGQEAYVLLFGPLKSGKSTLINAISGSYVSEVSSLPAYPCMVYLKYGAEPSYSVIRYSGKSETIESAEALKELLQKSHRTLSERIRAMEDFGETFDPASHLPSAIRRVSVELPVEGLKESGTVLVDTPGLYSKMKFGYDYMTREFRDSAACAVFIVKTDNLFLEQVFSDFNDLLDQFSRVFVVVNVDTGKSDLCPDGSLEPSLESRDPDQIVRAFEVLTMSAPLRRAADSGRLHIYPIDLRSAAARRLQADAGTGGAEPGEPDRFDRFLSDLMSYLNSTDYLMEFISDSIRQSGKLSDEIIRHCSSENVDRLQAQRDNLDAELATLRDRMTAALRVSEIDWPGKLAGPFERQAERRVELRQACREAVDSGVHSLAGEWLQSDNSLQQLKEQLHSALAQALADYRSAAAEGFSEVAGSAFGGAELDAPTADDLRNVGLDFGAIVEQAAAALRLDPVAQQISIPDLDGLPVHRTLADKLLFRSAESIRRKIIGAPDQPLPARVKQKRLAGDTADYIRQAAAGALAAGLDRAEQEECQAVAQAYGAGMAEQAGRQIGALTTELENRISALESEQASLDAIAAGIRKLAAIAGDIRGDIARLEDKHQQMVRQLQGGGQGEEEAASEAEQAQPDDAQTG